MPDEGLREGALRARRVGDGADQFAVVVIARAVAVCRRALVDEVGRAHAAQGEIPGTAVRLRHIGQITIGRGIAVDVRAARAACRDRHAAGVLNGDQAAVAGLDAREQ